MKRVSATSIAATVVSSRSRRYIRSISSSRNSGSFGGLASSRVSTATTRYGSLPMQRRREGQNLITISSSSSMNGLSRWFQTVAASASTKPTTSLALSKDSRRVPFRANTTTLPFAMDRGILAGFHRTIGSGSSVSTFPGSGDRAVATAPSASFGRLFHNIAERPFSSTGHMLFQCASLADASLGIFSSRIQRPLSILAVPFSITSYHSTAQQGMPGLSDFRDLIPRNQRAVEPVGRSWSATELRRKSYDDLHKLWFVLYKERNMLMTEQQLSRRKSIPFPQPQRIVKVRKSMGAIKQVLGERKRLHLSRLRAASNDAASTGAAVTDTASATSSSVV